MGLHEWWCESDKTIFWIHPYLTFVHSLKIGFSVWAFFSWNKFEFLHFYIHTLPWIMNLVQKTPSVTSSMRDITHRKLKKRLNLTEFYSRPRKKESRAILATIKRTETHPITFDWNWEQSKEQNVYDKYSTVLLHGVGWNSWWIENIATVGSYRRHSRADTVEQWTAFCFAEPFNSVWVYSEWKWKWKNYLKQQACKAKSLKCCIP